MTVYVAANFPGPLATKNNTGALGTAGINVIPVTLLNTTAQVWTHTFGQTPIAILPFVNSNTNGGAPIVANSGQTAANTLAITSNINAITVTPVISVNALIVVIWSLPPGAQAGNPVTGFA